MCCDLPLLSSEMVLQYNLGTVTCAVPRLCTCTRVVLEHHAGVFVVVINHTIRAAMCTFLQGKHGEFKNKLFAACEN